MTQPPDTPDGNGKGAAPGGGPGQPPTPAQEYERIRRLFSWKPRTCVLTGAGVSAESDVPTFRGQEGVWRNRNPMELATPEAFFQEPELVWEFYDWRRQKLAAAKPNPAHRALAALQAMLPVFTLATQNVDGLHQAAGNQSVLELHGSIWTVRCSVCGVEREDRAPKLGPRPLCAECGQGLLRPGVVWFGETLPGPAWDMALQAAKSCETMLSVGTSAAVQPASSLVLAAKAAGAVCIEVNPEETSNSDLMDHTLRGLAGDILPQLVPKDAP